MSENRTVSVGVQRALAMGAVVAGGATCSIPAEAQQAQPAATSGAPELTEVVVTGSRLRRVDAETASPVLTIDSKMIEQTGAQTVGELVDRIPSIAGAAMNPALNNGGGFGETNIELRGLGAQRTLILIDGQRVNLVGASGAVDVNQIPLNLIERVDVLNQGAGAVYGSDAIAGVVNFITKKNADGVELTGDWGETSKHDTQHHDIGLTFGGHGDKFNFVTGFWYNQQDELNMGQRAWSKYALYLYSGSLAKAGSSRTPTGRIYIPTALGPPPGGNGTFNCSSGSVTRIVGTDGTSLADYRCFISHGPLDDHFNFQPYNLNVTPQERGALFTKMNYEINDHVSAYASAIYNHTHSGFQIAPLPFDAQADNIVISANNIYNPFGSDFGGNSGANPNFDLRLLGIGDRRSDTVSASLITRTGIHVKIGDSEWTGDGSVSYNRLDQDAAVYGYFFANQLQNAVGPSFYAGPGNTNPTCGTPAAPITPCAPVNIFDLTDLPASATSGFSAFYNTNSTFISKAANLDFNGPLFTMWGGQAQGAVGVDYTGLTGAFTTSAITQLQAPDYLTCYISTETCSANSFGKYNFKEGYVEALLPLASNLPGVQSLNLDVGVRYSDYSLFGNTTRTSFKVEYRPVRDLLVRGSYAQIFRAPSIADISASPAINAPTLNDICKNYTGVATAAYPFLPDACVGVPANVGFSEPQNQVTGKLESNPNLKPETGYQYDGGFVFDPSFAPGLSFSADYWNYTVNNLITTLDPNYTIQQCGLTGNPEFCNLIDRYPSTSPSAGQLKVFLQPTFNLGTSKTDGIDFVLKDTIAKTAAGNFNIEVDETHLMSWTNQASPGAAPQQIAGQYSKQFGFYTKDRATVNVGWSGWGAQAMLTARYIGAVDIPLTNFNGTTFLGWHLPSVMYFDLTAGYTIAKTDTQLRAGILNLADKTPPIAGINTFNDSAVTDVFTYDTIGRRFFLGFTQKF
jgi:iron complex outermembrane receptor protein